MNSFVIQKASGYVNDLIKNNVPPNHFYHSFEHTTEVVEAAEQICEGLKLDEKDKEALILAAWFHDTGFIKTIENHEEISAGLAEKFLLDCNYEKDRIEVVKNCILVTNIKNQPQNLLEEIIRDADISHFGKKSFFYRNDLLRDEWEKTLGLSFSDLDWLNSTYRFFVTHPFYTSYAGSEYDKQRNENLRRLEEMIEEETKKITSI
jgi:predicted metal-dependent HD superfamily phosphohydrolase